jgi:CelD/BcsL family acetyltransferase involved in cellulose biosynthesis
MQMLDAQGRPAPSPVPAGRVRWETLPIGQMDQVEPCWRALHRAAWPTPVLAYEFVAALVKAFARGDEVVALARTGECPVAIGVLQRNTRFGWSTFQPSQAPLGAWLHDPAFDLGELTRSLMRALPGAVLILGVTQQDPLRFPRPADSPRLCTLDYLRTGAVLVNRSFEVYWAQRDKELRRKLKRRLARLHEEGLVPRLELVRDADDVAAQVDAFGEMESAGWKGDLGTAIHASNAQGAFYRDMLTRFCQLGCGRVYRYVSGERILGMTLCIEHEGTLASLKTTYDESLRAYAPGVLMKWEMFRDIFAEDGIGRVEFYGRIREWQLKWIDEARLLFHVNAYRSPLLRVAHAAAARLRPGGRDATADPAIDSQESSAA